MDLPARISKVLLSLLVFRLQVTVQSPFDDCCVNGLEWAAKQKECASLPYTPDDPLCRIAREQCCRVKLEEIHCENGINVARENQICMAFNTVIGQCNTGKKCCQCCLLGRGAKSNGHGCEANEALGYQCGQVYRACCVGDEEAINTPVNSNHTADFSPDTHNQSPGHETRKSPVELEDPFLNDRCRGGGPCQQRCTDTGTRVSCSCYVGYKLNDDQRTCDDVNECLLLIHQCQTGQRCINTIGSYQCLREISCGTGYELTEDNQCKDIDECEIGIHNCGFNFICQNTKGSFRCLPKMQCGPGFLQDALGNCIDINECNNAASSCQPGYTCINNIGSYSCQLNVVNCGRGYQLSMDGLNCVDIDECASPQNPCGEGHSCINSPGSFHCNCKKGYNFNSISRKCIDENECRRYPGRLCAHNCENTPGSYYCSCSKGFKLSPDGRNCEDVNECETNPCSQECANVFGSYQCYCRRGYQLSDADGVNCEDIDECALPAGGNICSYRCVNVPGSFQCACPVVGYALASNGRNCQDIDECITGMHNCSGTETCFNVQGSFRCLTFDCPENYRKSGDARCERLPCNENKECQSLPLRITYYYLTFPTNIQVPTNVFRFGPSHAVPGDNILLSITHGNEDNYFNAQELNNHNGIVFVHRQITEPRDFLLTVEMKLLRHGVTNIFVAKIYIVVTAEV
ncbi:fibulin-1 isoform X2 [Pristis pectinata]|uniref:fibulin-1 isoform X2 n=1 Tax=Pristis pectinata TaxID=685728 RepID=UPI00223E34A7|nr:fibulin-1 isoform X2 [Pristis pectinata]